MRNTEKKERELVKVNREREREKESKIWDVKKMKSKFIRRIKSQTKENIDMKLNNRLDIEEGERFNFERKKQRWRKFSDRVRENGEEVDEIQNAILDLIPMREASIKPKTFVFKMLTEKIPKTQKKKLSGIICQQETSLD